MNWLPVSNTGSHKFERSELCKIDWSFSIKWFTKWRNNPSEKLFTNRYSEYLLSPSERSEWATPISVGREANVCARAGIKVVVSRQRLIFSMTFRW